MRKNGQTLRRKKGRSKAGEPKAGVRVDEVKNDPGFALSNQPDLWDKSTEANQPEALYTESAYRER